MPRPPPRKLLVASIGVASMTYGTTTASVTSCGGSTAPGAPDSGNAVDSGGAADANSVPVGNPCAPDDTVGCEGGAEGIGCSAGTIDPEAIDPTLACTTPTLDTSTGENEYCCIPAPASIGSSTCLPDDNLPVVCPPSTTSYGYQCVGGYDPTKLDPSMSCGAGTLDPDGLHVDYCCKPVLGDF